jgi:serine/threonine-protein kinase
MDFRTLRSFSASMNESVVGFRKVLSAAGVLLLVRDYVRGRNLSELMAERPDGMEWGEARQILQCVLKALSVVHHWGLAHGNLTPPNIILPGRAGFPKAMVCDFALRFFREDRGMRETEDLGKDTALFLPKEALYRARRKPHRADVYSAGAILYYLLSGKPIRNLDEQNPDLSVVFEADHVSIHQRKPDLPDPVVKFIDRATSEKPSRRFRSATEMLKAFEALP